MCPGVRSMPTISANISKPDAPPQIYTVGGTVQAGAGIYLDRAVDAQLLALCRAGEFAYVLAPRQVGKSSLMVRTAEHLTAEGVRTALVDLTKIGTTPTSEEWYYGLLDEIQRRLKLKTRFDSWWEAHLALGPTQRLTRFFVDVVLQEIPGPLVVFIDEIDTTLNLPFTDDLYAAIRSFYDERAQTPAFQRLSFVLIGVAAPGDLIRDPQRTPFNIGRRVEISDFTLEEALPLTQGWHLPDAQARQVLRWALDWTGGHPYLTQRLCQAIAVADPGIWSTAAVDAVARQTFLGSQSDQDNNLQFVRDMLIKHTPDVVATLTTYEEIWRDRWPVRDDEQSAIKTHLKLSGIVRREQGVLRVRNRIYHMVFDHHWVQEHLPIKWGERLRRARVQLAIAVVVAFAMMLLAGYASYNAKQSAESRDALINANGVLLQSIAVQETEVSQKANEAGRNATWVATIRDQQQLADDELKARATIDAYKIDIYQATVTSLESEYKVSTGRLIIDDSYATSTAAVKSALRAADGIDQIQATITTIVAARAQAVSTAVALSTAQAQATATASVFNQTATAIARIVPPAFSTPSVSPTLPTSDLPATETRLAAQAIQTATAETAIAGATQTAQQAGQQQTAVVLVAIQQTSTAQVRQTQTVTARFTASARQTAARASTQTAIAAHPTPSPVPLTFTPTPTSTPVPSLTATRTVAPSPTQTLCPAPWLAIDTSLGALYRTNAEVNHRLGCPTVSYIVGLKHAAMQTFAHGYLFRDGDARQTFALYGGVGSAKIGTWTRYVDDTSEAGIDPGESLIQLLAHDASLREKLGAPQSDPFSLSPENTTFRTGVQPFENGVIIWANDYPVFVLYAAANQLEWYWPSGACPSTTWNPNGAIYKVIQRNTGVVKELGCSRAPYEVAIRVAAIQLLAHGDLFRDGDHHQTFALFHEPQETTGRWEVYPDSAAISSPDPIVNLQQLLQSNTALSQKLGTAQRDSVSKSQGGDGSNHAVVQPFQNGYMIWVENEQLYRYPVYVLATNTAKLTLLP